MINDAVGTHAAVRPSGGYRLEPHNSASSDNLVYANVRTVNPLGKAPRRYVKQINSSSRVFTKMKTLSVKNSSIGFTGRCNSRTGERQFNNPFHSDENGVITSSQNFYQC
jgi:hypothetical protein